MLVTSIFSSPEHKVPRVSYCDHSPSVVVHRPSSVCPSACSSVVCLHFLVYILAPTNINQSAPNLVKICMTITSRMSSIMDVIGPEPLELFAHELKKIAIFHFVYNLASTNINQSAPNLVKIYMIIRSRMSLILGLIGPKPPELFALEFKKLLYFTLLTL